MTTPIENAGSGTTWERYRPEGLLGEGAGGDVHLSLDLWTGERVAVKRYRSGVAAVAAHEASLLSEIRFPGVVRLLDCTTDLDGSFLAVFEYLRGRDLRAAAAGRPFDESAPLFADVLRALSFVHRRGIVHRDLKPANVLVSERDGAPRATVIDFGLATARREAGGAVGGTLAYLAPEVLEGGAPGARSDLYSLGVLLYEVLAGRLPSAGLSGVDVVRLHTTRDLRLDPDVAREVPPGLADVVRTLLRRDPALRFGSASEVLEALSRAIDRDLPSETEETLRGRVRSIGFPMAAGLLDRALEIGPGGLALTLPPGSEGAVARLKVAWAAAGRRVFHVRLGDGDVPPAGALPVVGPAGGVIVLTPGAARLESEQERVLPALLDAVARRDDLALAVVAEHDGPLPAVLSRAALPRLDVPRPEDDEVRRIAREELSLDLDERALRRLRATADVSPRSMGDGLVHAVRQRVLVTTGDRPRWSEARRLDRLAPESSLARARAIVEGLPEDQRAVAGALAVTPLELPGDATERFGLSAEAVRAMTSRGVVRRDSEGCLSLASDALALAALERLPGETRRRFARLRAADLEREGDADPERLGEAGILLVDELDEPMRARDALLEAGIRLRVAGRSGAARRYLERCLPLCSASGAPAVRLRALRWLADCDSIEGRNAETARRLDEAVTLPGSAEDRGSVFAILARTRMRAGDLAGADDAVDVGLGVEGLSGATRALLLTTRSMIRRGRNDMAGAAEAARAALDAAGDAPSAEKGAALMTLANACAYLGEVDEALATYHEAERLGQELGRADMTALAAANVGRLLHAHGRAGDAVEALTPILETFEREGETKHAENLLQTLMVSRLSLGDVAGVRALALKGREFFGQHSSRQNRAMFLRHVADAELRAGNPGEASRLAEESLAVREEVAEPGFVAVGLVLRARVETWQGAVESARATLARALRMVRRGCGDEQVEDVLSALAALHLAEGPAAFGAARRAADRAVAAARRMRPPRSLPRAAALAAEAALEAGAGDVEALVDETLGVVGEGVEEPALPVLQAARLAARAGHAPPEELSVGFERALEALAAEGHAAERALVLSWRARARITWARRQSEEATRSGTIRIATALSRARSDLEAARALYESLGLAPPAWRLDAIDRDLGALDRGGGDRSSSTGIARHLETIQRLHEVNKAIHAELEPARLLNLVLDEAIDLCGARRGFLILVRGAQIDVRVARNFAEQDIQHPEFQFSHSVARQVAMSGDPIRASDALHDPGLRSIASIAELRVTSILCVPLRARDQVIGSIYLDHPDVVDRFDDDDLEVLSDFASAAGMALERARLYQENVERTAALESAKQEIERLNAALMETVAQQAQELDHAMDSLEAERRAAGRRYDYRNIVTQSGRMEEVLRLLDRITDTDFPVLIQGESGTGKELVARAVHYNGPRAHRNFVSVNCAAMAEPLIEAELFGSMKGAFTGADRDRKGLFEIAHEGTLFLDEIGDMSLEVQKRLLRVVQYGEFYRVGGKEKVRVDVRIISATHRDLKKLIAEGQFREDLYYRLNVAPVSLPPVRERAGDVPLLLRHFAEQLERGGQTRTKRFSRAAMEALESYPWPGNVRELQNEIKRLLVLDTGRALIEVEDLPAAIRDGAAAAGGGGGESLRGRLDRHEKRIVEETLQHVAGNKAEAARRLGVSERGLYKILDRLGIERSTGRPPGRAPRGPGRPRRRPGTQDSPGSRR